MKHTKKHISCMIMIVLIIAFDQITKYFASLKLADGSVAKFIPGVVQFKYAENTGMAFSMLSGARWVFIGVILSGGIGNLIDRIRFGYVVDFIEPIFVNFAIFNIADCAVTCGAVVLVGYLLYDAFKDVKKPKENSDG